MEYIKPSDYEYIINKYHDTKKPFDPNRRFIRHDEIFDVSSGMDGDEIMTGILENDKLYSSEPNTVRKARAIEYVLNNTRISCDSRDIFPAVNAIDRPVSKTLIDRFKKDVNTNVIPETEKKRAQLERDGIVTIWPDYDHSVPNWERLFELGFSGILRESENARNSKPRTAKEQDFFEGIRITYTALISFLERLSVTAYKAPGSERMAQAIDNIRFGIPKTFYEALLTTYIYFIVSEHIDNLQVRSLSNFDRVFFKYYKNDLASGITEDELRTDLAYFILQFAAIGNYWNQPVYFGGEKRDGTTEINELSYIFLDVYDKMGLFNPKLQIKVSESTPKPFLMKALDMIRRGKNSIVFVSDRTIRKALMRVGVTEDVARLANITGCYEYSPIESYSAGMNYVNLMKPLEYALHGGHDGVSGVFSGKASPPLEYYDTFDKLVLEYKNQLLYVINETVSTVNSIEDHLSEINPLSLLSATFGSCIEKSTDVMSGGGIMNDSRMHFGFIADISDSLAMIRKHVYESKNITLTELVSVLDNNFVGYEKLQRKLYLDRDKYGNNKDLPDSIATDIVSFLTENICHRPNSKVRGGKWNLGFHVARMSYTHGKKTAASPNGRRLGEELSKNISASMGTNREGATAAILSATKIDASSFTCDAALDLGLLPSAVKGDDGLEAMYGLLMTFVKRGGHAMQINVFDAATLRDAQKNPKKYADLQIRVCGWNVLWNNISKEEQDGFIRQAEGLI